jgi:hypothetical protein
MIFITIYRPLEKWERRLAEGVGRDEGEEGEEGQAGFTEIMERRRANQGELF